MHFVVNNTLYRFAVLILIGVSSIFHVAHAQIVYPPVFGNQTERNTYRADLVPVYQQNFEGNLSGIDFLSTDVHVIEGSGVEISGIRSARFQGPVTALRFDAAETGMKPNSIYEVEFDYAVLSATGPAAIGVGFEWAGLSLSEPQNLAGPTNVAAVPTGRFRRQIRTGTDPNIAMLITNFGAQVVLDNIQIFRSESLLYRAQPPLNVAAFPRIGNYNLYSSFATALRNGNVSAADVESTLGLFDLVTGYQIDNTLLPSDAGRRLREINPNIRILPYHQTFVAQDDGTPPLAGTSGLLQLFNQGLQDAWFMRKPDGTKLEEPLFPNQFQMNHTAFAPKVNGVDFVDYTISYLANTVVPSGLWDGIHFDQSEWFPNPLLSNTNPFLEESGPLPPIDLNNDGIAESTAELEAAWNSSFLSYFDALNRQFGYTELLFGNVGEMPSRPSILSRLNGFQREFVIPYDTASNGDFDLFSSTSWHDLMRRYRIAEQHLREPQVLNFQFTGYKLGQPTGDSTENGLPDRLPVLESRDYQRMRLGMGTVLMGDGYFGYDFVDNTTLPVWFDEYAVGPDGIPAKNASAKGYLGQPLGPAYEVLGSANPILYWVDFEAPSQFPTGTGIANFTFTEDPAQVISGVRSVLFTASGLQTGDSMLALYSDATQFPLEIGADYQLLLDYRILSSDSTTLPNGFFTFGVQDPAMTPAEALRATAVIWEPEAGQQGTLRASLKARGPNATILAYMHGNGSIVVDNIRVIKGKGGVFRRDFENGIALVNPSVGPFSLSQVDVEGGLGRTGIRRIAGIQDPVTNDGSPVTSGITIPAADGIILLANPVAAQPNQPPPAPAVTVNGTSATVSWSAASGTVAGYQIEYGMDQGDLTRFALANGRSPMMTLDDLEPGTTYRVRVASYNFRGTLSGFSPTATFTIPGAPVQHPQIATVPLLMQGKFILISGANIGTTSAMASGVPYPTTLAGVQVLLDDVPVPIASVGPTYVMFFVPYNLAGTSATLQTVRDGVRSPARIASLGAVSAPALPTSNFWGQVSTSLALLLAGIAVLFTSSRAARSK
jgi:Fibronectin type III domain/Hypothetical glycosyl hydrolase family 15